MVAAVAVVVLVLDCIMQIWVSGGKKLGSNLMASWQRLIGVVTNTK